MKGQSEEMREGVQQTVGWPDTLGNDCSRQRSGSEEYGVDNRSCIDGIDSKAKIGG